MTSDLSEWLSPREQEITTAGENAGNVNWYSHLGNSIEVPEKIENTYAM